MPDANEEYRSLLAWGAAARLGIAGTAVILIALVAKGVLTTNEAIGLVDVLAQKAATQTSTTDDQKAVVAASYDQAREEIRQQ